MKQLLSDAVLEAFGLFEGVVAAKEDLTKSFCDLGFSLDNVIEFVINLEDVWGVSIPAGTEGRIDNLQGLIKELSVVPSIQEKFIV